MNADIRQRLWRVIALSLLIGAGLLAAYTYLVHQPMERELATIQDRTAKMQALVEDEEPPPQQHEPLPSERLDPACQRVQQALTAFASSYDNDAETFAVQELARSAQLDAYKVSNTQRENAPVQGLTRHRMGFTGQGSAAATDHLLSHLYAYAQAGTMTELEIIVDKNDDPNAVDPIFQTTWTLDAYTVPNAEQEGETRCNALRVQ